MSDSALTPASVDVRLDNLLAVRGWALAGRGEGGQAKAPEGRSGAHRAHGPVIQGRGMLFAESRPYQQGDDVRSIDWRVTARQGRPHTKVFENERERPRWIVVDRGLSMDFGSRVMLKSVLAAQVAAWLAWVGRERGDRIGGWLVDPAGVRILPPTAGDRGVLALLQALCATQVSAPEPSLAARGLAETIDALQKQVKRGDQVFLLSDFYGLDELDSNLANALSQLAGRAETTLLHVVDPLEVEAPLAGFYPVTQAGGISWLDLADPKTREAWRAPLAVRTQQLNAIARSHGCRVLTLTTNGHLPTALGVLR